MHEEGVGVILPQEETEAQTPPRRWRGGRYELIIVGGGPAGLTAGVHASRKMIHTLLISRDMGGQVLLTSEVESYMGFYHVEGLELVQKFEEEIRRQSIDLDLNQTVVKVEHDPPGFRVLTESGKVFTTATLIIATGKRSRELNVPGERELLGRGVSYCATCDAPLFAGKDVAVIGGGNSALTAVNDLLNIGATRVHVVNILDSLQADAILTEKTRSPEKVELHLGHEVLEIGGVGGRVANITIGDPAEGRGKTKILEVEGVFVEIGLVPNSELAEGLVKMNQWGEIITDCCARTSTPGVFAAGDVTTAQEKQIIVAAGDGCKAALAAYAYLLHR